MSPPHRDPTLTTCPCMPHSPLVPAPPTGPLCGSATCGAGEVCGPAATCLVPCMGAFGAPPGSTAGAPPAGFCWAGDWCGAPLPPPPAPPPPPRVSGGGGGGGGALDEGVGSPPDGGGVGVVTLGACCSTGRMRWGLVWDTAANVDIVLATPTGGWEWEGGGNILVSSADAAGSGEEGHFSAHC